MRRTRKTNQQGRTFYLLERTDGDWNRTMRTTKHTKKIHSHYSATKLGQTGSPEVTASQQIPSLGPSTTRRQYQGTMIRTSIQPEATKLPASVHERRTINPVLCTALCWSIETMEKSAKQRSGNEEAKKDRFSHSRSIEPQA